jgi:hypothetical protein
LIYREKSLVIILIFIIFFDSWAQEKNEHYHKVAKSIVATALIQQKGYQILRELCEIGPRLSGYETSFHAIQWMKIKMEQLGLDRVWLQPVMVPYWSRGFTEQAVVVASSAYKDKHLNIAALGGSIGTPPKDLTGMILEINSFEELQNLGSGAAGKIIFYNRPIDQGKLNSFSGYGGAVNQCTKGAIAAAKVGAIATIVRSVTTKYDNIPHVGVMYYEDEVPQIPAVAIGLADADSTTISKIEQWLPYLQRAGIDWLRKGGSGSDISKIKKCNTLIGYIPDNQRYFDFHHSENDVFEAIHPREMELGSAAITILTYLLSEEGL